MRVESELRSFKCDSLMTAVSQDVVRLRRMLDYRGFTVPHLPTVHTILHVLLVYVLHIRTVLVHILCTFSFKQFIWV